MGDPLMPEEQMHIGIRDFVELTSSQIATKVIEKLKIEHIDPIYARLREIELKLAAPSATSQSNNQVITQWRGALDAAWKIGLILFAIVEVVQNMHH